MIAWRRARDGASSPHRRARAAALVALALAITSRSALADEPRREPSPGVTDVTTIASAASFVGGAISALALHESGHLIANLAYGNIPALTPIRYEGVVPFLVVDARLHYDNGVYYKNNGGVFSAGRQGYYVINTAGFEMQNLTSEIVLSLWPRLIDERAPFRKGLLLMNVALSIGYATASVVGFEDPHGDLHGAVERGHYPRLALAAAVATPAALDLTRFLAPNLKWAAWASRGTKVVFLGMDF